MFTDQDIHWMQRAISLAEDAAQSGEVPVGAVLVQDDAEIASGFNAPISLSDPTAHAEIMTLRKAAMLQKNYRLIDTTLYVTLEPCMMCIGALVHARVKRLVYGAFDMRAGAVSSQMSLAKATFLNHKIECHGGLLAEVCGQLLSDFFKARRAG